VVVEFEPPAFLTTLEVERLDLFTKVGQLAQEEVPARIGAPYPDGKFTPAAEGDFAARAFR
jgi:hypothetical protein